MSTAPALDTPARHLSDLHPDVRPGGMPGGMPGARPPLHLVPTGTDVRDATDELRPIRLTRRGRLVRAGVAVGVAFLLGWAVVGAATAGAATPHLVTVTRGQTLSEIAAQQLHDRSLRRGVAELQLANGLSTSDIHAGQILTIPVAR